MVFTSGLTLQKLCFSPEAPGPRKLLVEFVTQCPLSWLLVSTLSLDLLCNLQVFATDTTYRRFKADCIQSCRAELQSCRDNVSLPRLLAASGNQVWDLEKARKVPVRLVGLPDLCCAWKEPVSSRAPRRLGTCEDWLTGCLALWKYVSCLSSSCPHWIITDY